MSRHTGHQWSRQELIAALQTAIGDSPDGPVTQNRYLTAALAHNASLPPGARRLPPQNKVFSDEWGSWAAAVVAAGYRPHSYAIHEHERLMRRRGGAERPRREELLEWLWRFARSVAEGLLDAKSYDRWAGQTERDAASRGELSAVPAIGCIEKCSAPGERR